MNVPFLDVQQTYSELRDDLDAAYRRVMQSGSYILSPEVAAFENEFAQYCGARECIGTASGLDALHLILRAYGVGAGHEVIVPAHTFIATWLAVSQTGAKPVPVDVDPVSGNIDVSRVEAAITPATRAVIAVHLYGQPAEIDSLAALCRKHGIALIEDAAQAQGAEHKGRKAGTLGDAAAFSFYPAKNLGAFGDAGAVVTNDRALANRIRLLRNYGSEIKYRHEVQGFNSRLDPLQAAFLRVKLAHLGDWNEWRRSIAERYLRELRGIDGLVLPETTGDTKSSWHLFVVKTPHRAALQATLAATGIETQIHYPVPPHRTGAYRNEIAGEFPIADYFADQTLSLPIGPHLGDEQVAYVIEEVCRFFSALSLRGAA